MLLTITLRNSTRQNQRLQLRLSVRTRNHPSTRMCGCLILTCCWTPRLLPPSLPQEAKRSHQGHSRLRRSRCGRRLKTKVSSRQELRLSSTRLRSTKTMTAKFRRCVSTVTASCRPVRCATFFLKSSIKIKSSRTVTTKSFSTITSESS